LRSLSPRTRNPRISRAEQPFSREVADAAAELAAELHPAQASFFSKGPIPRRRLEGRPPKHISHQPTPRPQGSHDADDPHGAG
jgi:hypothetical protein